MLAEPRRGVKETSDECVEAQGICHPMREERVTLSAGEPTRVLVLNQVEAGVLSAAQAGQVLGLGARQVRRLRACYRQDGASRPGARAGSHAMPVQAWLPSLQRPRVERR